jgi:hypothetical protein
MCIVQPIVNFTEKKKNFLASKLNSIVPGLIIQTYVNASEFLLKCCCSQNVQRSGINSSDTVSLKLTRKQPPQDSFAAVPVPIIAGPCRVHVPVEEDELLTSPPTFKRFLPILQSLRYCISRVYAAESLTCCNY